MNFLEFYINTHFKNVNNRGGGGRDGYWKWFWEMAYLGYLGIINWSTMLALKFYLFRFITPRGCSRFTYTAASTRCCLTNSLSHPFEQIHTSSAFMPSSNHHRQHHYKTYTRGNWNQAATTIPRDSLCANVPQAWRHSACIGNSQRDQHHFETTKMGRGFLWERPLYTPGQQGRAPRLCVSLQEWDWQKLRQW